MPPILIVGGGPAGSSAALSALAEGAAVRLYEKSSFPRHKVCGEFLSPEIQPALESLGVWSEFQRAGPSRIRSVRLHFGRREKRWTLSEPAFGLSRYQLDRLLFTCAVDRGAEVERSHFEPGDQPAILAHGRRSAAPRGRRLFGFKAHFSGPVDDAVDLFFDSRAYAGVSSVEDGITNVCGLAPESLLTQHGFDMDRVVEAWPALRERIAPLARTTEWLTTGPLVFGFDRSADGEHYYRAGDALGFVDPFTGSGILSAIQTGRAAGTAAARQIPSSVYQLDCAHLLKTQYWISGLVRFAILSGLADDLARWLPGSLLFSLTRPRLALK